MSIKSINTYTCDLCYKEFVNSSKPIGWTLLSVIDIRNDVLTTKVICADCRKNINTCW